jgi:hypothetical protein
LACSIKVSPSNSPRKSPYVETVRTRSTKKFDLNEKSGEMKTPRKFISDGSDRRGAVTEIGEENEEVE